MVRQDEVVQTHDAPWACLPGQEDLRAEGLSRCPAYFPLGSGPCPPAVGTLWVPLPCPPAWLPRPHPLAVPYLEGVGALDVNTVSDPRSPQLPSAPPQQDRSLGGTGPQSLQEQLEAASLRAMQIVIEDQLWNQELAGGPAPGQPAWRPCEPHPSHRAVGGA